MVRGPGQPPVRKFYWATSVPADAFCPCTRLPREVGNKRAAFRPAPSTFSWCIFFIAVAIGTDVAAEWLTFLLRIRKVPGSCVGEEIGCPDRGFSLLSTAPPGKHRGTALKWVTTASFRIIADWLFINHPVTLLSLGYWLSLNKLQKPQEK
jgi:hypothetical protein